MSPQVETMQLEAPAVCAEASLKRSRLDSCPETALPGLRRVQSLVNLIPIHNVPPRLQVFRPAIVVFEIVCVFPYVIAEDRIKSLREWAVLVRRRHDLHFATRLRR